jgi:hypothetical protein
MGNVGPARADFCKANPYVAFREYSHPPQCSTRMVLRAHPSEQGRWLRRDSDDDLLIAARSIHIYSLIQNQKASINKTSVHFP